MSSYSVSSSKSGKKYAKHYCKSCCSGKKRESNRSIKEKAIAYLGGGCGRCGYVGCPAVFDFHHIDPSKKEFSIGGSRFHRFELIKDELDKCELLCSNCHRELHYKLTEG